MPSTVTEYDTIAAISTPPGEGGISIVRVSGDQAINIVKKVFKGKDLAKVATHTINYGHIVDPTTNDLVDEVMVSVMRAPKTYTREDVIEVNTHGGIVPTNKVLQLLIGAGARMAEPGEFTKRAFLNGRLDLTQAESVMDLIRAKTDKAMQVAVNQLDGNLEHLINSLRQEILDVLAQVEVNIDYPEYDTEQMTTNMLLEKAKTVGVSIDQLLKTADSGEILQHGLATAIIGKPNVGKSSLLNRLLDEDKAIVTDVAGTTRDIVEQYVNIDGVPLKLIDTAGIRDTEDKVEKIGVERSLKAINEADLIILVLDSSRPLEDEDIQLLDATKDKRRIVIFNKNDLTPVLHPIEVKQLKADDIILLTSAIKNDGIEQIKDTVGKLFNAGIEDSSSNVIITSARQAGLLRQAKQSLNDVISGIEAGMPIDLVQIDMTSCWDKLGEITGDSYPDELITQLFSQFCLGK
ncbi:tRNA uridine-5-carboxymethylaminomethyl(34) synthesis GTPase MnmE [Companilactobacillus sp.]|jgi:tRNA modification GTPase|uniref:tRNA uridine-5-carboxymethylaminomethyl(34) synthesis GTPase MnmE n=1 Tax=Companilactobacillus sp. TaxID=2767905 RepID=UPI0025C2CC2C|nr:tRNA uridine-5-carboxymethylaminomethyl(34) synthesis GTPase MnmE [Companilactobacillus sp.]MCH4009452.1 tRNA uridine-5-carboxymethylaminomethyl(34) synthesis GTPase MnmE [Companilactobacillus sp.]MCH4050369.1 tRNA uridine-5-carboxymethylaminomethyl(34) synthesis GTPase MnmE [Companilactobacillus sp.]MCH4077394.1 tRNA uridine-5-carboxymethylaminomethyl(34) synthesis GTPase MnmE [Companilactobacillus sp.]MCH4125970.1 tRNA uridine-5-carboxymethylaminomethyl(34) synthesis GTPase MnmE [Companila